MSTDAVAPTTRTSADPVIDALLQRRSPVATVVLEAPDASEDAQDRLDIRAKAVRADLIEAGLPEAVADAAVEAFADHEAGEWIAVAADPAGTVTTPLVDAPAEIVSVGALPRFVPFVRDRFEHRPHVVVRCDRTGASIARVVRGEIESDIDVSADEVHVQKVKSGGWSQAGMQRHAEHTWDHNAQDIADAVVAEAQDAAADLVVVTGDLRAVGMVRDHLPEAWVDKAVFDDAQPTDESSDEAAFERAATLVRDAAAREIVAVLERFAERRGRADGAADRTESVLSALRRGQVETLLVTKDVDETVYTSVIDAMQVSTDESDLSDMSLADVVPARLADAAIRAAIAGGADVVVTPEHGPDTPDAPLGAILRY